VVNDERAFLERSLADLELERAAGDLSDADHADLKARYERKLAELDATPDRSGLHPTSKTGSEQDQNGGGGRRWGRLVATVVVVLAVGVGAGVLLSRSFGSREAGDNITGSTPTSSSEQLAHAAQLFSEGKLTESIAEYQAVLDENPKDVEALTYFGWTLRNISLQQDEPQLRASGIALIEKATQLDPTYAQAWFFRGIIYYRDEERLTDAVDALKLALANDPISELAAAARELLAEIAGATTTTTA
jgi:tetratricopeptide (TPR) repeat protein